MYRHTARLLLTSCCGALVLLCAPALSVYLVSSTEQVPVARLIANLQVIVDKNPDNVRAVLNLARAHAMAYSLKTETADVLPRRSLPAISDGTITGRQARLFDPELYQPEQTWSHGYGQRAPVSFDKVVATNDPAKLEAAKEHLAQALAGYKRAAQLAPENLVVRLGLAWLTEQSGNRKEAIRSYRDIVAQAWQLEQALTEGSQYYITSEAGRYLIPLLDPVADKPEIDRIKGWSGKLEDLPRRVTPIAIPLASGLAARDIEDATAAVMFDADGWGIRKPWTWITPQAAWLVYQSQADSPVDSALDWFGSVTFWMFWNNGYEALSALDDDQNGRLEAGELQGLALWHDANGDGVSGAGEIAALSAHGIVALSYDYRIDTQHPDRIAFVADGVIFADGSSRPSYDLILHAAKPRLRL